MAFLLPESIPEQIYLLTNIIETPITEFEVDTNKIKKFIASINSTHRIGIGENVRYWKFSDLPLIPKILVDLRNIFLNNLGQCKQDPILEDMFIFVNNKICQKSRVF